MKIFSKFTLPQIEYDSSDYLPENIVPNHLWWNIKKFTFLGKFKVCTRFKLIFFWIWFFWLSTWKYCAKSFMIKYHKILGKFKVCTKFKLIFFSLKFLILNNNKTWYRPRKNSRSFLVIFFFKIMHIWHFC